MAGTPKAFDAGAFQNNAFQTGAAVSSSTRRHLLPLMKIGFMWLLSVIIWRA